MFNLITVYLLKRFLWTWILSILFILSLIVMIDITEFYKEINVSTPVHLVILYSLFRLPNDILNFFILHLTTAGLIAFWFLSRSGEFLAIICSGVSPYKVVYRLYLLLAPAVFVTTILLSSFAAYSMEARKNVKAEIFNITLDKNIINRSNVWISFYYKNDFYYAQFQTLNKDTRTFHDALFYQFPKDYKDILIHKIEEIKVDNNKWYLANSHITNSAGETKEISESVWNAPVVYDILAKGSVKISHLSFLEILATVRNSKKAGLNVSKYLFKFAYLLILPVILFVVFVWSLAAAYDKARSQSIKVWKWVFLISFTVQVSLFYFRLITSTATETFLSAILLSLITPIIALSIGIVVLYYYSNK